MLKINTLRTFLRSILGARTGLFFVVALLLAGCSAEKSPEKAERPCGELPPLEYAKNLKIGDSCGTPMTEIRSIVGRDTLVKRLVLPAPLTRVVALSSAQIGYMLRLGEQGRIVAVGDGSYIADSALYRKVEAGDIAQVGSGPALSLEKLMELKPQLVLNFATGGGQDDYERIEALGLPLLLTSEWQEEHPLAKAEWIKLYGMLFGVEARADSIYRQIKEEYLRVKEMPSPYADHDHISAKALSGQSHQVRHDNVGSVAADETGHDSVGGVAGVSPANSSEFRIPNSELPCPRVLVGMSYGGVWYAPGANSYTAQLIKDAGGCYLFAGDSSRELRLSLEQVMALADSTDVWINPGMFSTPREILAAEPRAAHIKAFKEKRVYQNDSRRGPGGGNDFYESAVTYPEALLEELSRIFGQAAGDSQKNVPSGGSQPRWYRNIYNF